MSLRSIELKRSKIIHIRSIKMVMIEGESSNISIELYPQSEFIALGKVIRGHLPTLHYYRLRK
jgi:hypothetical protein